VRSARAIPAAPRRAGRALLALAAIVLLALPACRDPLLTEQDQRSQYDRYDRVRNDYEQQYIIDEFGQREPNLRGRLSPKR